MRLSPRLETVFQMIPASCCIADVGCDHGQLSCELILRGKAQHVIASDLREGPLSQAEGLVRKKHLEEKIELRLTDGLDGMAPGEAETLVICGMGGLLICQILKRGGCDLLDQVSTLVLQPQTDVKEVRVFLHQNGFQIMDECVSWDRGKYYFVLKAVHGQEIYSDPLEYQYGIILPGRMDPVYRKWLKLRMENLKLWCSKTTDEKVREDFLKEISWIEHCL